MILDPDRGRGRRALLRDKGFHFAKQTAGFARKTARDIQHRSRGTVATLQSRFAPATVSDDVLISRVRSALGRICSHPRLIEVGAQGGCITLIGAADAAELVGIVTAVRRIPGVVAVSNKLTARTDLQSNQGFTPKRTFSQYPFTQANWSPTERFLAGSLGTALTLYGLRNGPVLGCALGSVGLLLITRAVGNTTLKEMMPETRTATEAVQHAVPSFSAVAERRAG